MEIILNGETYKVAENANILHLVASLGLDARKIAIEKNLEIVPKSQYQNTAIAPGDRIEIVNFIGGG